MNLLHNVVLHKCLAFWNKFGMPLPADLQIFALQHLPTVQNMHSFNQIWIMFQHYKLHTLLTNFLNESVCFSEHLLLLTSF